MKDQQVLQETTIYYDREAETLYLDWLMKLDSKIERFSQIFNDFSRKVEIAPFSKATITDLSGNADSWAERVINKAVEKQDVPLRNSYLEYYYSQFNLIKKSFGELYSFLDRNVGSFTNRIPSVLFSLENLPEIETGNLVISDEFINRIRKYFKITVSTDNEAFKLLDQFLQTYNSLYELGKDKGLMALPITSGRGEGIHILTPIETFLQRRNDGTVTINNDTLNRLIK